VESVTAPATTAPKAAASTDVGPVGDRSKRLRRGVAYAFLIGYAFLMFVPFIWAITTSFKTNPDALKLTFIPNPFTTQGWDKAFTELTPGLVRLFLNSGVISVSITVSNVVLGAMAGYAFARLRFPGRELLFLLVLGTLMIPDQLRLVPIYNILNFLGLLEGPAQYGGVFLVGAITATSIFLLRQYFLTIPRDLEEAAKIDGAGFLTTFWRVMLPLAVPAVAAVAILSFQGSWNAFFWPLIILQDRNQYTLPLALSQFRFQFFTLWPAMMAVVTLATIPIVILYLFFQRYFVEGIAATGVKG
jgi:multiple sugar transport system permease protein